MPNSLQTHLASWRATNQDTFMQKTQMPMKHFYRLFKRAPNSVSVRNMLYQHIPEKIKLQVVAP
jgi:hypothetical protein